MGLRGRSKTLVLRDVKNGWREEIILRPSSDLLPARQVSFAKRMTWFLGCWHTWCLFFLTGQSSSTGWGAVIFVWFNHDMHNSQGAPCRPQQWGQPGVQFCYCSRRPTSNPITHNSCASSSFPSPLLPLLCNSRIGFVIIGGSEPGWVAPTLSDQRNKSMR